MKWIHKRGMATYLIIVALFIMSVLFTLSFIFDLVPGEAVQGAMKLSHGLNNFGLQIFLAIIYGAGFIFVNYFLFIAVYLKLRKNFPKVKYVVEIMVFLAAFLVSIAVKIIVLSISLNPVDAPEGFINTLVIFYRSIYMTIGGVQFEGLMDLPEGTLMTSQILYFGSSIIFGLVAITLITFKAAYELYSYFQFRFFFKLHIFTNYDRDIYVFTDLNEQTFLIADSIQRKYESTEQNYMIIFTGPNLKPYDRKNELCSEAMGRGFLYWSYSQNNKTNIPNVLGLKRKKNDQANKFYIFAFDIDENGKPREEQNAQFVIDDINHRYDRLHITYVVYAKKNIHYRAYEKLFEETKGEHVPVDTSNMSKREARKAEKLYIYRDKTKSDVIVWSEPQGIADQVAYVLKRNGKLNEIVPNEKETYCWLIGCGRTGEAISKSLYIYSANMDSKGRSAKFTCLVFDREASKKVSMLSQNTPCAICVDREEVEEEIEKEKRRSELAKSETTFKNDDDDYEFPFEDKLFHKGEDINSRLYGTSSVKEAIKNVINYKNELLIADAKRRILDTKITKKISEDVIKREFSRFATFPTYIAIDSEFFKADFFKEAKESYSRDKPNYIVISSGNDLKNIEMANTLVNHLRQDSESEEKKITIFVTIYDRKNNFLLSDFDESIKGEDKKVISHLDGHISVVIIGNREDTFKFEKIIFEDKTVEINRRYTKLTNKLDTDFGESLVRKLDSYNAFLNKEAIMDKTIIKKKYLQVQDEYSRYNNYRNNYIKTIEEFEKEVNSYLIDSSFNNDLNDLEGEFDPFMLGLNPVNESDDSNGDGIMYWRKQTIWKKASTNSAYMFSPTYSYLAYDIIKDKDIESGKWSIAKKDLVRFMQIEHLRWCRFHYADGWMYNPELTTNDKIDRERYKYHQGLIPYSLINPGNYRFDIANVIYALQNSFFEAKANIEGRNAKPEADEYQNNRI